MRISDRFASDQSDLVITLGYDMVEYHPHLWNQLLPAQHTDTAELLQSHGFPVHPVPFIELAKAEAGVTCCSLLL